MAPVEELPMLLTAAEPKVDNRVTLKPQVEIFVSQTHAYIVKLTHRNVRDIEVSS